MRAEEILYFAGINATEPVYVKEIADSIRKNGWIGCPILVMESFGILITGSHRLEALKLLADEGFDLDSLGNVAEAVDDIVNAWCAENDTCFTDIRFDCLSDIFAGTWVEQYKDEIGEW